MRSMMGAQAILPYFYIHPVFAKDLFVMGENWMLLIVSNYENSGRE